MLFLNKLKVFKSLQDTEKSYGVDSSETKSKISELTRGGVELGEDEDEDDEGENEDDEQSIEFTSESMTIY